MKIVLLLRHAKSAWGTPGLPDHERPLNRRGEHAARVMAQYIADRCPRPDLILCSTAVRTRRTLAPLLKQFEPPAPPIALEKDLYLAPESALLGRLQALPDSVGTALLIGHNDGIGQLAAALVGSGPAEQVQALRDKFPTAALAVLRAPAEHWPDLESGSANLLAFVRPRDLGD
ncbi:phosphohistidine phosphatase [Enhydrobacter aerosaccus]|uniref:Phosphohistidine phosphatase n=1 Tax=Enhydrobacter aerosaccus TaxID=225324 RepID=A0A1T4KL35_9HYPH|nr:histidine phosphatase family protein [Enhydrobacter aerosaccus]SJZ43142.1 phosphohistidine phosphatase [Enhydrobacter aerosaccus]